MSFAMPRAARDATALVRNIRSRGFRGVCRAIATRIRWRERMRERYFEWKLGISTAGIVASEALGHRHPDCHHYDPSWYGSVRTILQTIAVRDGRDVFIDFGSGKGRVLVLAAMYPFQRIIGIECVPQLNACAKQNLERARRWMTCQRVDVITTDAAVFEIPDDATVLYFQNPFSGQILDAVLRNIKESVMRVPRRILVISHSHDPGSQFEARIRTCPWLQLQADVPLQPGTGAWIYTNAYWTE